MSLLFFAIPQNVAAAIMPADVGLIVADAYGMAIVRDAAEHKLQGATRHSVLLRFAKVSAQRSHDLQIRWQLPSL